jgi:hypothetical protein
VPAIVAAAIAEHARGETRTNRDIEVLQHVAAGNTNKVRYAHSNYDAKRRAVQLLIRPVDDNAKSVTAANDNHAEHSDKVGTVPSMKKEIAVY